MDKIELYAFSKKFAVNFSHVDFVLDAFLYLLFVIKLFMTFKTFKSKSFNSFFPVIFERV